jgi:hypothetical protein
MIVNDEVKSMLKEAVIAYFKALSPYFTSRKRKITKTSVKIAGHWDQNQTRTF